METTQAAVLSQGTNIRHKFEDVPARNAFEYLQTIYIARN